MDDLVQWLNAQLDEDERIARAVHGPIDGPLGKKWWTAEDFKTRLCDDQIWMSDAAFIAVHDPARVLREIEAKRDLLVLAEGIHDHHATFTTGVYARLEKTLRLYALAYKDRPGYRAEWAPTE